MLFSTSHTARENEIKARIGVKGRKKKRNVKVQRGDINPLSAIAWWILGKTEATVAAEPGCFSSERKAARSQNGHWIPRIGALGPFPHSRLPSRMSL